MPEARVFCTCFDRNYLSRGLALYHSLKRYEPSARLWVLALDETAHRALGKMALPDLMAVRLSELEAADPELAAVRTSRSLVEYYFTCTPAWMRHVLDRDTSDDWVTYLDADLYFFRSFDSLFSELGQASFAIIPHRYTQELAHLRRYGTYNVGWVGARRDADGVAALEWWRERCIEWCYDHVDGDRFADQGYLDGIAKTFPRVAVIQNVGANLAPWNVGNHSISWSNGEILIDSETPLIFFHFQGLKKEMGIFLFNSHRLHRAPFCRTVRDHVYRPYVDEVLALENSLGPMLEAEVGSSLPRLKVDIPSTSVKGMARSFGKRLLRILDIVSGRAFIVWGGKAH